MGYLFFTLEHRKISQKESSTSFELLAGNGKHQKYETLSIQFLIDMQVTYGIPVSAVCFESSSSWGFNPFPDMKVKLLCHPN